MAKQERTRKSLPQNKAKSYQDMTETIEPWVELDEQELRVFNAVIDSRERETWSDSDIELATKLARFSVEADRLWALYKEEGPTILNQRGTLVENPVLRAHTSMINTAKSLRATLGISASQRGISGHKQAKRNQQDRKAKRKLASVDSLLAKPKK